MLKYLFSVVVFFVLLFMLLVGYVELLFLLDNIKLWFICMIELEMICFLEVW